MSIENLESPREGQPFIWFAKSYDGTILTEFEDSGKQNEFDTIDKVNLKEFGLIGRGSKLWYSTEDGILNIFDKKVEFYIEDEEQKIIKLSGIESEKYNDIIQYKGFYQDFAINTKNALGGIVIDSYHFGYKHVVNVKDKGDIYMQSVFRMPMDKPMKIGFRFATTFDLKGKLFIKINGEVDTEPMDIMVLSGRAENYEKDFF